MIEEEAAIMEAAESEQVLGLAEEAPNKYQEEGEVP